MSRDLTTADLIFLEVSPPGREPQVRALKGKVGNPYAVAWASYGASKAKRKKKEAAGMGGLGQVTRCGAGNEGGPGSGSKGHKTAEPIKRGLAGYKKPPNPYLGKNPKYMPTGWGATHIVYGRQADTTILKALMQESVEARTYRFSESNLMEVVAPVTPVSKESAATEGCVVTCVLITEGLGNRADMHYYGPECIRNGVGLFEGQPCFVDHQKRSEQQDQPERTVRDKCGYFKNVRAENVDGRLGLVAELHYDLSETGRYAYDKACTAIHYKQEFPGSDKEYVGLSIAADGKLEERVMQVNDEVLDVKYVTEFTAVGSVDEVTSPARGGRFVQVGTR